MRSQNLFNIFEFLGIPVTEDLETVQRALDDLPASRMAELRKESKFSELRRILYTKKATPAYLEYVKEIIALQQSNQQDYNQQDYNQQEYNQQEYNQQEYNQQEYDPDELLFDENDNLELNKPNKNSSCLGCAFLIFVCFCIFSGISTLFDNSGSTTLSNPKVKFTDVDRQSVRISWEPVEHADYYLLDDKSDDLPETEIRNRTDYIVFRHDDRKTEYSLIACSDDEKFKPSSSVKISIESVKSHLQETENETEEEPEDNPEDKYTPSVLTPEPSSKTGASSKSLLQYKKSKDAQSDNKPSKSVKTVLNAPQPRIVETKNSVLLVWDIVENADRYLLEVKMGRDGKNFSKVVNDNMYSFTTLKPNKEYFITVTAIPKDNTQFSPSPSKTISYTTQSK